MPQRRPPAPPPRSLVSCCSAEIIKSAISAGSASPARRIRNQRRVPGAPPHLRPPPTSSLPPQPAPAPGTLSILPPASAPGPLLAWQHPWGHPWVPTGGQQAPLQLHPHPPQLWVPWGPQPPLAPLQGLAPGPEGSAPAPHPSPCPNLSSPRSTGGSFKRLPQGARSQAVPGWQR